MYTVKCDGALLYDPRVEELKIFNPKVSLEVNKTGGFDFLIYPSHPMYSAIKRLKSKIEVYHDDYLLFRGRVLNDELGFYNEKNIICEGDLAFFNDSIIRPYDYNGSVSGFLELIINEHNLQVETSKQFVLGNVTVTDPNDYITRSSIKSDKSWKVINDKLIDKLGGFIMVRRSNEINYIDYFEDSPYQSLQEIKLGENLLDLTKRIKGQNIITALIPYGAKLKDAEGKDIDERLDIKSVNNDIDYVFNQDAVDLYGWIFDTNTWNDVTIASNLLTKANEELAKRINIDVSIELSAIDLSMMDKTIDEFRFFEYVKVNSPKHLLNDYMLVSKLDIHLLNPKNNKLTVGLDYTTFTEKQIKTEKTIEEMNSEASKKETSINNTISEVSTTLQSNIEQTEELIRREVTENYTAKSDFETYQSQVSTKFDQTSEDFLFQFTELTQQISNLDDDTKAQFNELIKYIRFESGNIILGEVGNEITLKIQNDRIAFLQNNLEVAYLSNNTLYITDTRVLNSIRIGNFAFIPRSNGNLSFKKVGE